MVDLSIIKRPIITEKTSKLREYNKYVFEVDVRANKNQIKEAVERLFNVSVIKINTLIRKGKPKRSRAGRFWHRREGRTRIQKRAIITLKEGQIIPLFEV